MIVTPKLATAYRRIHTGISYRLRTLAAGRWAEYCWPTSIVLMITERCNARCVHCDIWKNRGQEESPTPEQWKALLRDLARWLGPVHVVLSGGEALLRPYTPELVREGVSLGLYMEVLTHGYWMEQSRIEQLALARPARVTVSLDGIGATHSRVRGREAFWDYTQQSLETLTRLRAERALPYSIRLKTVLMDYNLDDAPEVARFAAARGMEVFYQPIEQNYNTADDPEWFTHTDNWPKDAAKAVRCVETLIRLRREGLPIRNSMAQFQAMIAYFRNPAAMRVSIQGHSGHEARLLCGALTTLQIQSNGDVTVCAASPPVGNIKMTPIREIWRNRPRWWEDGCCLSRRLTVEEKEERLVRIGTGVRA